MNLGGTFALADLGTFNRSGGKVYLGYNLSGVLNNAGTTLALDDATGSWVLNGGTIRGGTITTGGSAILFGLGVRWTGSPWPARLTSVRASSSWTWSTV